MVACIPLITLSISVWLGVFMFQNLETALAGGLGQMSLVRLPNISTQSKVFISGPIYMT